MRIRLIDAANPTRRGKPDGVSGAIVWLTAFWFNPRKQQGPACDPVSANLPGGGVSPEAA